MGVICFASLKGGVGKTSLSLNVSAAFAERGCETLLIDLDPTAHSSRFFRRGAEGHAGDASVPPFQAPLARLFFADGLEQHCQDSESICDFALASGIELCIPVRPGLHILPASSELRYFMWGRGAQFFSNAFAKLLSELSGAYDSIIIDTPPDFNVVTRNAIAVADIVAVPIDSSEMSIHCLEELVANAAHIVGPTWVIARTMVNRQASRVQQFSQDRLSESFDTGAQCDRSTGPGDEILNDEADGPQHFLRLLRKREAAHGGSRENRGNLTRGGGGANSPIYLLNSTISRTEQQNRLTFLGRTAFEERSTRKLAAEYLSIARELEELLSLVSHSDPPFREDKIVSSVAGLAE